MFVGKIVLAVIIVFVIGCILDFGRQVFLERWILKSNLIRFIYTKMDEVLLDEKNKTNCS